MRSTSSFHSLLFIGVFFIISGQLAASNPDSLSKDRISMSLYPNPTASTLNVEIIEEEDQEPEEDNADDHNTNGTTTYSYSIGDIFGKRKKSGEVKKKNNTGPSSIEIDVRDLSAGTYIIIIYKDNIRMVDRFVVQ